MQEDGACTDERGLEIVGGKECSSRSSSAGISRVEKVGGEGEEMKALFGSDERELG